MLWMHNIAVNQILLCFNTFCLEEFSDCDKAETFGLQYGNELIDSSNSLFVALEIVEQEDDTVTCTSCQALYTLFGSDMVEPVFTTFTTDESQIDIIIQGLVDIDIWWTEEYRRLTHIFLDQSRSCLDFFADRVGRELRHRAVGKTMVLNLVALVVGTFYHYGTLFGDIVANDEERCLDTMFLQYIEHVDSSGGVGTIVKTEGHQFFLSE